MGLVYHNGKFIPEENIQKSREEAEVLRLLRSFLDKNEPGIVRILLNTWKAQGKAITYKQLREAILNGDISRADLEDWVQDYSRFVIEHLRPAWIKAIGAAAAAKAAAYPEWLFDPMSTGIMNWSKNHAAEFVTNVTTTQINGLRAVIQRAAVLEHIPVDDLARALRPMVGLTKPQAVANMKYYESLLDSGVSQKRARDLAERYAARQHRKRAYDIARTELATAYNTGAYEATKQAQAAGYMGRAIKVWCTADDERTCPMCSALEGKEVDLDGDFEGISSSWSTRLTPPAHTGCRCGYLIKEVSPPER